MRTVSPRTGRSPRPRPASANVGCGQKEWLFPFNLAGVTESPKPPQTPTKASGQRPGTKDPRGRPPLHKCVGHFCEQSLIVPLTSLDPIHGPSHFTVRYNLEGIRYKLNGRSPYMVALAAEKLRQLGPGTGVDVMEATKSWLARDTRCSSMVALGTKLVGETNISLEQSGLSGMQTILLVVVGIYDLSDQQDWLTFGDPCILHVAFPTIVDRNKYREACVQAGCNALKNKLVQASTEMATGAAQTATAVLEEKGLQTSPAPGADESCQTEPPALREASAQAGCLPQVEASAQAGVATADAGMVAAPGCAEGSSQTPQSIMLSAATETLDLTVLLCNASTQIEQVVTQDAATEPPPAAAPPRLSDGAAQTVAPRRGLVEVQTDAVASADAATETVALEAAEASTARADPEKFKECLQEEVAQAVPIAPPAATATADAAVMAQPTSADASVAARPSGAEFGVQVATAATGHTNVLRCAGYTPGLGPRQLPIASVEQAAPSAAECRAVATQTDAPAAAAAAAAPAPPSRSLCELGVQVDCQELLPPPPAAAAAADDGAAGGRAPTVEAGTQVSEKGGGHDERELTAVVVDERAPERDREDAPLLEAPSVSKDHDSRYRVSCEAQTVVAGFVPLGQPQLKLLTIRPPRPNRLAWQCLVLGLIAGFLSGMILSNSIPK